MYRKNIVNHCHYARKYRSAAHNICNLKYYVPKDISIFFEDGSNYEEFEGQPTCLR